AIFFFGIRHACKEVCDFLVARERLAFGFAFAEGANVGFHDVRQQRSANGAMWRGKHPSDGSSESMNGAKTRVGEGESPEETGNRHILARRTQRSIRFGILVATGLVSDLQ